MKIHAWLAVVLISLVMAHPLLGQGESPPGHMVVRHIKTKPGKSEEYLQFQLETTGKAMQVRANEGDVDGWVFARAVLPPGSDSPSGSDSTHDYILVNIHNGLVSPRVPIDPFFAKAGVSVTREEWYARLGEQTRLLHVETWRNIVEDLGRVENGNYLQIDYLTVPEDRISDWAALARGVWAPLHQARIRKGELAAWQAQVVVDSDDSSRGHNVRVVTIYPNLEALGRAPRYRDLLAEIDPERDANELFAAVGQMQEVVKSELFEVVGVVWPSPAGGE